ncbi:DUF397 domain-containing protein [Streptomyces sp. NPDC093568]|uniref:DUF397 domain-containing protein n=1 Tax=Streptomyces sp. NPDC093568 TaxID=3366041 RepID=UPI003828E8F8
MRRNMVAHQRVDAGHVWVKSSRSAMEDSCVEFTDTCEGVVAVRDSKNSTTPYLRFSTDSWKNFISRLRDTDLSSLNEHLQGGH